MVFFDATDWTKAQVRDFGSLVRHMEIHRPFAADENPTLFVAVLSCDLHEFISRHRSLLPYSVGASESFSRVVGVPSDPPLGSTASTDVTDFSGVGIIASSGVRAWSSTSNGKCAGSIRSCDSIATGFTTSMNSGAAAISRAYGGSISEM